MKQRDFKGKDISLKCSKILQKSKKRLRDEELFEKESGYTVEDLQSIGFSNEQIQNMQKRFSRIPGRNLYRKLILAKKIKKQEESQRYTDKTNNMKSQITKSRMYAMRRQVTKISMYEWKNKAEGLHPDTIKALSELVAQGKISSKDAEQIIEFRKGDKSKQKEVYNIELEFQKKEQIEAEKEFEQECGYTIQELEKIGFSKEQIEDMQAKFDMMTGERIDRKQVVEQEIIKYQQGLEEKKKILMEVYEEGLINYQDLQKAYSNLGLAKEEIENLQEEIPHQGEEK